MRAVPARGRGCRETKAITSSGEAMEAMLITLSVSLFKEEDEEGSL